MVSITKSFNILYIGRVSYTTKLLVLDMRLPGALTDRKLWKIEDTLNGRPSRFSQSAVPILSPEERRALRDRLTENVDLGPHNDS